MLQAIPSVTTHWEEYMHVNHKEKKNLLITMANANVATVKAMSMFSL